MNSPDGDVRWGIVGTGRIASAFVEAVQEHGSVVSGVASRSPDRAAGFVAEHHLGAVSGTIDRLIDTGPDAVYIGSSNHHHVDDALRCLDADIPVLCEKPLTTDLASTDRLIEVARDRNVFLMEAMWMRFQPAWMLLESLLEDGTIGPLRTINADFGFRANDDPTRRWFDPTQGGGSLLDVGIYPLTLAYLLAGAPIDTVAVRSMTDTGVDGQYAVAMKHADDVLSIVSSSIVSDTNITATVSGPLGRLHLAAPFHHSSRVEHWRGGELIGFWDVAYDGSGYTFEVAEVERCLRSGLTESPRHPLSDTRAVMKILDDLRGMDG